MNKNEYRRAFIMLRPAEAGWSGHVRLEHRVMTGNMYFIVNAPVREGTIRAALAGQRRGEYFAAPLGALRPDSRGQSTLAYAFDPRLIEGHPLEAYQWIAVALTDDQGCRIALTGNVDGAHPMDVAALREAVCALYQGASPAADLPEPDELPPVISETAAAADGAPAGGDTFEATGATAVETFAATQEDEQDSTLSESPVSVAETRIEEDATHPIAFMADVDVNLSPAEIIEAQAASNSEAENADAWAAMARADEAAPQAAEADDPSPAAGGTEAEPSPPARLDTTEPAENAAPQTTRIYTRMRAIRALSGEESRDEGTPNEGASSQDAVRTEAEPSSPAPASGDPPRWRIGGSRDLASPCAMPLEDGYTYVRVPLPAACGMSYCLIGIRADDDRVTSVRTALPGTYAAEPPEGLEGGIWVGAGDGSDAGYWVHTIRCRTDDPDWWD